METKPILRWLMLLLFGILLIGCAIGYVSETSTLMEKPFAVQPMRGDITEATRCVGRYWQKSAIQMGAMWNVYTDSYEVRVQGPGGGVPPVGLVIVFDDIDGKTVARAHVHRIFPETDPRRTVTLKALDACSLR